MGLWDKIKEIFPKKQDHNKYLFAFTKSREGLFRKIQKLFTFQVNEEFLEQLMESLLAADLGFRTSEKIITRLEERAKQQRIDTYAALETELVQVMMDIYGEDRSQLVFQDDINVLMLVGVNGAGKSTTCAKLARLYQQSHRVMIIAADTFRSAATLQIGKWAEEVGVYCYIDDSKSDPSAVVVDGLRYARNHGYNLVIIDSAGRLHNKENLMQELAKMKRVITKEISHITPQILLVLDSNNGYNSLVQAETYHQTIGVDGVILTKIDGNAKGMIVLAIKDQLNLPVKFLGLGEKVEDLSVFDLETFLYSIVSQSEHHG